MTDRQPKDPKIAATYSLRSSILDSIDALTELGVIDNKSQFVEDAIRRGIVATASDNPILCKLLFQTLGKFSL